MSMLEINLILSSFNNFDLKNCLKCILNPYISESKLDDSVPTSEIQIDEYDLLRCDRNRHEGRGGGGGGSSLLYQK